MMLVSALAGDEHVMALYRHAIAQRYRFFFSYGDAVPLARRKIERAYSALIPACAATRAQRTSSERMKSVASSGLA